MDNPIPQLDPIAQPGTKLTLLVPGGGMMGCDSRVKIVSKGWMSTGSGMKLCYAEPRGRKIFDLVRLLQHGVIVLKGHEESRPVWEGHAPARDGIRTFILDGRGGRFYDHEGEGADALIAYLKKHLSATQGPGPPVPGPRRRIPRHHEPARPGGYPRRGGLPLKTMSQLKTPPPPRPKSSSDEVRNRAAAILAPRVLEWCEEDDPGEYELEDIEKLLRQALSCSNHDGYALASSLDGDLRPNTALVEILDDAAVALTDKPQKPFPAALWTAHQVGHSPASLAPRAAEVMEAARGSHSEKGKDVTGLLLAGQVAGLFVLSESLDVQWTETGKAWAAEHAAATVAVYTHYR